MAEDHGAPEAEQLPRVWTRGRRDKESPKSERRKEFLAGQMRGVLGRVSTGAAGKILSSANPREIRT